MKKSLLEFVCVAVPKISGGLFTVGLNIILVRFMEPESFGIYSLCVFGILLADGIIGSAIDLGVLKLSSTYRNALRINYALSIEKAAFFLKLLIFVFIFLCLLFVASPLSIVLFHQEQTVNLLWLSCCAAMGMILLRSFQVHLQVQRKFILYGLLDILLIFFRFGGIAIVLYYFSVQPFSLLISYAIAPFVLVCLCLIIFGKQFSVNFKHQKKATMELINHIKWFILTFALGAVISRLDIYILTSLASIKDVGIYSGGMIYAMIPELLGSYISLVLGPKVMIYIQKGTFFLLFRKVQLFCFLLSLVLLVCTIFAFKLIAPILLPDAYSESAQVFLLLLPGSLSTLCVLPVMLTFLMFLRPKFWFTMELVSLPLLLISYFYFIPKYGVAGAAGIASLQRIIKALIGQFFAYRLAKKEGCYDLHHD